MADSVPTADDLLAHTEWLTRLARALVEIDTTPGPVTLDVAVKTDKNAPLPMGGLFAVHGAIDPQTAEELRDGTRFPVT